MLDELCPHRQFPPPTPQINNNNNLKKNRGEKEEKMNPCFKCYYVYTSHGSDASE